MRVKRTKTPPLACDPPLMRPLPSPHIGRLEFDNLALLKQRINVAAIKLQAPSAPICASLLCGCCSASVYAAAARMEKLLLSTADSVLGLLCDTRCACDEGDADATPRM